MPQTLLWGQTHLCRKRLSVIVEKKININTWKAKWMKRKLFIKSSRKTRGISEKLFGLYFFPFQIFFSLHSTFFHIVSAAEWRTFLKIRKTWRILWDLYRFYMADKIEKVLRFYEIFLSLSFFFFRKKPHVCINVYTSKLRAFFMLGKDLSRNI